MKTCLICKETLPFSEFNKDQTRKDGHQPYCRTCVKAYKRTYYKLNSEKLIAKANLYRAENLEKLREYDRERQKQTKRRLRGTDTWRGKAVALIASMRGTSRDKGFEWSDDWWNIEELTLRIQDGRCEKTGVPFNLLLFVNELYKTNPYTPSVDRIDNSKNYHPDNVQIVTWFYNNMKRDHSQELVDEIMDSIIANAIIAMMD